MSGVDGIWACGYDCSVACRVAATSVWTVGMDVVVVSGVGGGGGVVGECDCSVACCVAAISVWSIALDSVVLSGVAGIWACGYDCSVACRVAATSVWTVGLDVVVVSGVGGGGGVVGGVGLDVVVVSGVGGVGLDVSCCLVQCNGFRHVMPYGTCWGSWLRAFLGFTNPGVNPPTTHMSPCLALSGHIISTLVLRMSWLFSWARIRVRVISSEFISPPRRNLLSPMDLLALVLELLCSRFFMSWNRCASVSFGLPDGACTFTTSMPSSSVSPGIVHRKACALRR